MSYLRLRIFLKLFLRPILKPKDSFKKIGDRFDFALRMSKRFAEIKDVE